MILVTGASGFIGSALLRRLADRSTSVRATVRRAGFEVAAPVDSVHVGDLTTSTDWRPALTGIDAVIHTAARVHMMAETDADALSEYRRVNVEGTLSLARQAAAAGVRRFIFISTIKVNGEQTNGRAPFRAEDTPQPVDAYGISKLEAELGLSEISRVSRMEVVTIRPPLVYGPGVGANFRALMRWIHSGIPLPLGSIHNQRSLAALDNLMDLIVTCIDHPKAANQTLLVSDGTDLSTTELVRRLGCALGTPARMIPFPAALLHLSAGIVGRADAARRLCDSLQVDLSMTRKVLGWTPPVTVNEGLRRAAESFLRATV